MCMSCGCGAVDERHKEGDITRADMEKAAANAGVDVETVADNIQTSAEEVSSSK